MEKYSGLIALAILVVLLVIFIKYQANKQDEEIDDKPIVKNVVSSASPLDLNDCDATVAALIASIECRNEYHKNVQVISVRKVG